MSLQLTIGGSWDRGPRQVTGGTDVSSLIDYRSLSLTDTMRDGANTMSFDLLIPASQNSVVAVGLLAQLLQDGQLMFAGPIKTVTSSVLQTSNIASVQAPVLRIEVSCSDWTDWLDRRPIFGTYPPAGAIGFGGVINGGDYAGKIVRSIIDDPNPKGALICSRDIISGVNGNNGVPYDFGYHATGTGAQTVDDGLPVQQQILLYRPFTQVISEIARQIGYVWYVGSDRIIHFFNRISGSQTSLPSNTLDLDADIVNFGDCVITEDASQVITRVLLIDAQLKNDVPVQVASQPAAGGQFFFPLGYHPSEDFNDFSAQVFYPGNPITSGAPDRTYDLANNNLAIEYRDGIPAVSTRPWPDLAYICNTNMGVRIGGADLPAGSTVVSNFKFFLSTGIDRYFAFPPGIVAVAQDSSDASVFVVSQYQGSANYTGETEYTSSDGADNIHTRVISDPTLTMSFVQVGTDLADSWLRRFGTMQRSARFTSFTQGWHSGQHFTLSSVARNFNPSNGNVETMWISQVVMKPFYNDGVGQWQLQSTIECSNNPWGN